MSVDTDYQSTNVSLVSVDGRVLSQSLISSASASTGLSAPLSGDVDLPSTATTGDDVVLIDRYPASVLSWVNVHNGSVAAQLSVRTGFASNPQDFVPLSQHEAYVTRLGVNLSAGREPFDGGSDILIVDPSVPEITGRIDLTPAMAGEGAEFYPRPHRALKIGAWVYVILSGESLDFHDSAPSRLVRLDPQSGAIAEVYVLDGLHGCSSFALSPGADTLAVTCSGTFLQDTSTRGLLDQSGIALIALGSQMTERARFMAAQLGAGPLGFGIAFADDRTLIVTGFGTRDGDDTVDALDLDGGQVQVLLRSTTPFGEVGCAAACGVCFVADPGAGVLRRFVVGAAGGLDQRGVIAADPVIGLPPRLVGWF